VTPVVSLELAQDLGNVHPRLLQLGQVGGVGG